MAAEKFKVAVLGAGVGGSTATYFLRKAFGSSVQIDVFEKTNKIGGRTRVIEMGRNTFEAGASIIHDSNRYLLDFCTEYGKYMGIDVVFKIEWSDFCFDKMYHALPKDKGRALL